MGERGVVLEKTKIGSPLRHLRPRRIAPRLENTLRIVGWEANGGFLTGSDIAVDRWDTRSRCHTRDSTLPILANFVRRGRAAHRIGRIVWNRLPARFGRAGLLDNVPVAVSQAILALPDSTRRCDRSGVRWHGTRIRPQSSGRRRPRRSRNRRP